MRGIRSRRRRGEVVDQQLTAAVAHTGVPREILSDGGSDLQAGIAQFQQAHPETQALYDINHKTALVVKQELAEEALGKAFAQQAAQTKQRVRRRRWRSWPRPPNGAKLVI